MQAVVITGTEARREEVGIGTITPMDDMKIVETTVRRTERQGQVGGAEGAVS